MCTSFLFLLSLVGVAHMEVDLTASYTTSFKCKDGTYALIGGDTLTLEYDYGKEHKELQSFHLRETSKHRHMFDFENPTGDGIAYIKDSEFKRLKSFNWTDTGIKFVIENISNLTDWGKYQGEVEIPHGNSVVDYAQKTLLITEISDPPPEVKFTTPSGVMDSIDLKKGFAEKTLNFSAMSYSAIQCKSVEITLTMTDGGSGHNKSMPCSAKDAADPTECPFTLKEENMTEGKCVTVEGYAEQDGVQSEKKTCEACFEQDATDPTKCPFTLKEEDMTEGKCVTVEGYAEQYGVHSEKKTCEVCHEQDATDPTECRLTLKEEDMTEGKCVTVEGYAEQYGVHSEKKTCEVCYEQAGGISTGVLAVIIIVAVFILIVIAIGAVLFMKRRRNAQRATTKNLKVEYKPTDNPASNPEDV